MSPDDALAFVAEHGIVLEAASGPVPSLAREVAGEPIRGSWWGHERAEQILAATRHVRGSDQVLTCRLVGGKVTYVHRRLWPALARLAEQLDDQALARVVEVHTPSGHHEVEETPFPEWVPDDVLEAAVELSDEEAWSLLEQGGWP